MKKRKLNYRFHDPNSAEVTADYITKLLIEVNSHKADEAVKAAANVVENTECCPAKVG